MKAALANQPEATMSEPPGIVTARIDPHNGELAPPGEKNAIFEVFQQGDMPKQMAQNNAASNTATTSSGTDLGNQLF